MSDQKKILIIGLGETGLSLARWYSREQKEFTIIDTRNTPPGQQEINDSVEQYFGEYCYDKVDLSTIYSIVISPGLALNEPVLAKFLENAQSQSIEVIGEIEVFARALQDLAQKQAYLPKVLAITGTNGKTTVTSLVSHLINESGLSAKAAGNISPSALNALMQSMDEQSLPNVWVLELSSFQLVSVFSLVIDASVVLNISQDHLDWHGSMQAYIEAKSRIYALSKVSIVNKDDAVVLGIIDSQEDENVRCFGQAQPKLLGDLGLINEHDMFWLASQERSEFDFPEATSPKRKKITEKPMRKEGLLKRLMPADALQIKGMHNIQNALAALLLCKEVGLGWASLLAALRSYVAQAHRCEFVRQIAGVEYINDSKGTNVGATVAALNGFAKPMVLIAGGLGKGQDFSPLAVPVSQYVKAVLLIGQDASLIAQSIQSTGVPCVICTSLEDAVKQSFPIAKAGDLVLLSPACASMDMFKNYGHRGQVFVDAVNELALDNGEII